MRAAQVVHNAYMDRYPVLLNVVTQLQLVNGTASITTAEVRRRALCAARACAHRRRGHCSAHMRLTW